MTPIDQMIVQIDQQILNSRAQRDFGQAIERLLRNADYRVVIAEGYLKDEAIRLVHARTDPAMQKPDQQADILRQIDGIACFSDFLRTKLSLAENAAQAIDSAEDMRDQLISEVNE